MKTFNRGILFLVFILILKIDAESFKITKNHVYKWYPQLSPLYVLSFDIKPLGKVSGWTNIIHFTTGANSNVYGSRTPGAWFQPFSTKLYICAAVRGSGVYCRSLSFSLALNSYTNVIILQQPINGKVFFKIFVGGKKDFSDENYLPGYFSNVTVYTSNPWVNPANAEIKNYRFTDLANNMLTKLNRHERYPTLSPYFTVSFDLLPFGVVSEMTSIIHLTTGGNYAAYGDRTPAVFFQPNSTKLKICSAINGNSNHCWNSSVEMQLYISTNIKISQQPHNGKVFLTVSIDGQDKFHVHNAKPRYFFNVTAYTSDPWYKTANVAVTNYKISQSIACDHLCMKTWNLYH